MTPLNSAPSRISLPITLFKTKLKRKMSQKLVCIHRATQYTNARPRSARFLGYRQLPSKDKRSSQIELYNRKCKFAHLNHIPKINMTFGFHDSLKPMSSVRLQKFKLTSKSEILVFWKSKWGSCFGKFD